MRSSLIDEGAQRFGKTGNLPAMAEFDQTALEHLSEKNSPHQLSITHKHQAPSISLEPSESSVILSLTPITGASRMGAGEDDWLVNELHMHLIGHQMPFLNFRFLLKGELAEHFAQMLAQLLIQRLASTFRNEDNMIFALPCRVA